jgi:transketolase
VIASYDEMKGLWDALDADYPTGTLAQGIAVGIKIGLAIGERRASAGTDVARRPGTDVTT